MRFGAHRREVSVVGRDERRALPASTRRNTHQRRRSGHLVVVVGRGADGSAGECGVGADLAADGVALGAAFALAVPLKVSTQTISVSVPKDLEEEWKKAKAKLEAKFGPKKIRRTSGSKAKPCETKPCVRNQNSRRFYRYSNSLDQTAFAQPKRGVSCVSPRGRCRACRGWSRRSHGRRRAGEGQCRSSHPSGGSSRRSPERTR